MSLASSTNKRRILPRTAPLHAVEALVRFQQQDAAGFKAFTDFLDACRDDLHEKLEDMSRTEGDARADRAAAAALGDVLAILREAPTLRAAMHKNR